MQDSLFLVIVSQIAFLATLLALGALFRRSFSEKNKPYELNPNYYSPVFIRTLAVFYILGWSGRIASRLGVAWLTAALGPFATVGGALLLIFLNVGRSKTFASKSIAVFLLEILWAFLFESKASIFIPLLALVIRWSVNQFDRKISVRNLFFVSVAGLMGFFAMQNVRGIINENVLDVRESGRGPLLGAFISFIERFDGFSAYVDALWAHDTNGWLSPNEYFSRLQFDLVPKVGLVQVSQTVGQLWTREVKSQSLINQFQDVSIAAGYGPEGFALGGLPMLLVFSAIGASVVFFASRYFLSGNVGLSVLLSFLFFSPALFEQGTFGAAVCLNKGLQLTFAYFVISSFFRSIDRAQFDPVSKVWAKKT